MESSRNNTSAEEDLFYRVIRNDVILMDLLLPLLDWHEVSSFFLSCPLVESIFRSKGCWKTLIKRCVKDENLLDVLTRSTDIDEKDISNNDDPLFFHQVGNSLARSLLGCESWEKVFSSEKDLPRGFLIVPQPVGVDAYGRPIKNLNLPTVVWDFMLDDSQQFLIGHALQKARLVKDKDGQTILDDVYSTVYVWEFQGNGNLVKRHQFSLDAAKKAQRDYRSYGLTDHCFVMGTYLMIIYDDSTQFSGGGMFVWNWRRGTEVAFHNRRNGNANLDFFECVHFVGKRGFIATGASDKVRVWMTNDGWRSVTLKFPEIPTVRHKELDFNDDFLVASSVGRDKECRETAVVQIWSMKDGSRLHKLDALGFRFILMEKRLIYLGDDENGDRRWKYVELLKPDDSAAGRGEFGDSIGDFRGDSGQQTSLQPIILTEFDKYLNGAEYPFPKVIQPNIEDKFVTAFSSNIESNLGESETIVDIWDAKSLLRSGRDGEDRGGSDDNVEKDNKDKMTAENKSHGIANNGTESDKTTTDNASKHVSVSDNDAELHNASKKIVIIDNDTYLIKCTNPDNSSKNTADKASEGAAKIDNDTSSHKIADNSYNSQEINSAEESHEIARNADKSSREDDAIIDFSKSATMGERILDGVAFNRRRIIMWIKEGFIKIVPLLRE